MAESDEGWASYQRNKHFFCFGKFKEKKTKMRQIFENEEREKFCETRCRRKTSGLQLSIRDIMAVAEMKAVGLVES